ncbi:hypothetical protein PILCRDRAFT_816109 [Piloderma croceum F 1598]|uniref:U2 small nuclear ribonucleoprotein A' n=1 Tax=Piloderma croceum (strain F 1598) TaxID=765440 RepID=A0A0C3G2V7_PILCF|nr:hypothetical protein PILCRDRAFT_816109 [Piloderma croceum F 1598]
MDLPAVGTRISVAGSFGTVKFAGSVDNTKGVWLGIEWDDPDRGKHSGTKDGKRYFECRIPNAGSFMRPSASICYGISFLTALRSKYIETQHGTASLEKVVLGSSKGAIEVEAVGLDKIRGKFAQLERLREISVDYENVATADSPGEVRNTCPNVRGVDLSSNLLPSWDMVALIAVELPQLERLALNRNRLAPFKTTSKATLAFPKLTELQLNGTLMTWSDAEELVFVIPSLRLVEMGYNRLRCLSSSPALAKPSIHVINLDGNELDDWAHICETFQPYRNLGRLILSSNRIRTIPPVTKASPILLGIKNLALSFNDLRTWRDIDSLSQWCPTLETLSLRGNYLVEDPQMGRYARQLVIAKIPSLRALDAAAISSKERVDCELFYLSLISKGEPVSDEERLREHPRWDDLCASRYISTNPPHTAGANSIPLRAWETRGRDKATTRQA